MTAVFKRTTHRPILHGTGIDRRVPLWQRPLGSRVLPFSLHRKLLRRVASNTMSSCPMVVSPRAHPAARIQCVTEGHTLAVQLSYRRNQPCPSMERTDTVTG